MLARTETPVRLPSGTVTFLFTDVEGSTALWQQYPRLMAHALERHHEILRHAIEGHGGIVFQVIGDAFCAAFVRAFDAVASALEAQRGLAEEPWGETGPLRVRMGLHTGSAEPIGQDYPSSLTLIRTQRCMSAGHGGQMLLSAATAELVRDHPPAEAVLRDLGLHHLRGLTEPERVFQLVASGLPADFPPLRSAPPAVARDESSLVLDQLVQRVLVGRTREADQLREHWNRAQNGQGRLVLLSGEPGIGKTRLAEEVLMEAAQSGAVVLRGGCYEYEATTPYLPFVEALRAWVHATESGNLRELLGPTAPEIVKLAPEVESKLGARVPNSPLPPNEERLRLFDNMARLVQRLAMPHGLVVFVDDLHWADQGSLSLLHYLARNLRSDRLLLLGAYREVELDRTHPLAQALVEWNRERLVARIGLGRLSREETRDMLAALFRQESISEEFAGAMYRETEGNPFFVEEVVKSLIEQGQIYREAGKWQRKTIEELAIPQSVKEAIGRRLDRLSEDCITMLHGAAALGKSFSFAELETTWDAGEDRLLNALDEANSAQLIRLGSAEEFAFTHDKIREVLYEELNPIRRRRLHQRIGEGLERLYGATGRRAQELAYHFVQSTDFERAYRYSQSAAQNAVRVFAYEEALGYYRQARDAAEQLERPAAIAATHESLGDVYRLQGIGPKAVTAYTDALTLVTEKPRRAVLKGKLGDVYAVVGDPRGLTCLDQALGELDPQAQADELARVTALIGRYHHYRAELSQAVAFLERARQLAEARGNPFTLMTIYSYLAGAYQHLVRYPDSDAWARASIALAVHRNALVGMALGYEFLGENAVIQGYWDEGLMYAALDRAVALKIGAGERFSWSHFVQSNALFGKGDPLQSAAVGRAGLEMAERIGEDRLATWLESMVAMALSDLARDEEAEQYARRGARRAEQLGQGSLRCWSLRALAYYALRRQDWPGVKEVHEEANAIWQPTENLLSGVLLGPWLAKAYMELGHPEKAIASLEDYTALVRSRQLSYYEALAQRVRGELLASQGDTARALTCLDSAIDTLTRRSTWLELGRTLEARGTLQASLGAADRARADWTRARHLFQTAGAAHDLRHLLEKSDLDPV